MPDQIQASHILLMYSGSLQSTASRSKEEAESEIKKLKEELDGGADFSHTEQFSFRKEVKPKLVGLTLAGSGSTPIALGEW